jgi:hypothetical protein
MNLGWMMDVHPQPHFVTAKTPEFDGVFIGLSPVKVLFQSCFAAD